MYKNNIHDFVYTTTCSQTSIYNPYSFFFIWALEGPHFLT